MGVMDPEKLRELQKHLAGGDWIYFREIILGARQKDREAMHSIENTC